MFNRITMIDFRKPLADRKRKMTGPYYWVPSAPNRGRGFYMAMNSLAMDAAGSSLDLRIEWANDHLSGSRLSFTDGYFLDDFCDDTAQPIIARLPRGRGFLAGYTLGFGMASGLSPEIYETEEAAAMAAHDEAERMAEDEREYREQHDEDDDAA